MVTAGVLVVPGQPVYEATDGDHELGDASAAASADIKGVAVSYADDTDALLIVFEGDIDLGAVLAVGTIYVVSDTSGAIMPATDLSSGEFTTILGIATTTSNLSLKLQVGGVAIP